MKTKIYLLLTVLILSLGGAAHAQFDFGGMFGQSQRPAWQEFPLNQNTRIRLDFRNSNVDAVLRFYQDRSGITIIKDPSLTGAITVTSAEAVSLDRAFTILNTVLSLRGYDMRAENNMLVIRQRAGGRGGQQRQDNPMGNFDPSMLAQIMGSSNTELRVYRIEHANAAQVARVINEVFVNAQDPMQQLMGMFQGMQNQQRGGQQQQGRFGNFQRGNFGRPGQNQTVRASSDDYSNSVIVNAPRSEHEQVANLIKQIDRQTEEPLQPKVYRLQFAPADEIAPVVQNVLVANAPKGRGGAGVQNVPIEQRFQQAARLGGVQAAFGTVVADMRTNSLVVSATKENHAVVSLVIEELDQEVTYEASTVVIQLNNARADQMATLLNQAFGVRNVGGQFGGFGGGQRQGQGGQMNRQLPMQQQRPGTGGQQRPGTGGRPTGRSADGVLELDLIDPDLDEGELYTMVEVMQGGGFGMMGQQQRRAGAQGQMTGRDAQGRLVNVRDLAGQVTVIPDSNTNSLIVVTSPDNAEMIRSILEQLDRIPEQVMIETIIVEATLDRSLRLGVEWQIAQQNAFNQPGSTATAGQNFGLQTATPALQGFRYAVSGGTLNAFMNALQTDQRFEVLSTPRIFTSNNVQAQINISQRVPYVISQREDALGNLTFNYAFEDVGIVLTVTPRIAANGIVTMDIIQTANDLQGFTTFNAPIINQRQANTTVSVRDGETIILGGIIRNSVIATTRKIPLLGDIPVLGNLFRTTDRSNVKTELLVFLTPRIVRDDAEAQRLRQEQQNELAPRTQEQLDRRVPPTTGSTTGGGGN
jgi:general secretion pathway protein D